MEIKKDILQSNRIDVEMARRRLARSRSEAADLIARKKVFVNDMLANKASEKVSAADRILIDSPTRYVGRAGEKLEYALKAFNVNVSSLSAIDIGSSTGGFTQCLLDHGAKSVTAIDVGTGQFAHELRDDPRVELHESTDIRKFKCDDMFDIAVVDVSFISLSLVLPKIAEVLRPQGVCIALVKPQFEVGMELAKKCKGVILDEKLQSATLEKIKGSGRSVGLKPISDVPSPIEGEKGNREFLLHLIKD